MKPTIMGAIIIATFALTGCGGKPSANVCQGNVAIVKGSAITKIQYAALLKYTLGFYEAGDSTSPYYGKQICSNSELRTECASVKSQLLKRMIDQSLVSTYAADHDLLATPGDWNAALRREHKLIKSAGGEQAFLSYLKKLGTDEAQFRFLEGQEIETTKVSKAMGKARFKQWLTHQEKSAAISRCPLK